jgi:hypothetical protein
VSPQSSWLKPSRDTQAHILADMLFTVVARIAMEDDAEVLTYFCELVRDAAQGERSQDEPLTASLLENIAKHVERIRDQE